MSEFGGLLKHEKSQHALVGLGSAALFGCCSLTQVKRPEFPETDNKTVSLKKEEKKRKSVFAAAYTREGTVSKMLTTQSHGVDIL